MSKTALITIMGSVLLFVCSLSSASSAGMRATLFSDIDVILQDANDARASVLAPNSYGAASKLYKSAEDLLKKGKNIERIRKSLDKAEGFFNQSIEATKLAKVTLLTSLQARDDAEAAQAKTHTKVLWSKAEQIFVRAAKALESGNVNKAKKYSAKAETEYRNAELAAIKVSYLDETRKLIAIAKKQKVDRYAPSTLKMAKALLSKAEKGLNQNRYDTDESRLLAKQAHYEVKHALYIAKLVMDIDDDKLSIEDFILQSEQPVVDIASGLDLVVQFDEGLDGPTTYIRKQVASLRQDSQELADAQSQLLTLEAEIETLGARLGVQSNRLAKQEKLKQRLSQVESMFTEREAIVMSKGGNVLIRTIGLNFGSGSDQIHSRNFSLLKKVQQSLNLFPNASVVIEGHTDSFGGDSINLNLSKKRAEAVMSYLMANMPGGEQMKIEAVGYGEAKPIGNNETSEGRTKNRRIDLIIIPAA